MVQVHKNIYLLYIIIHINSLLPSTNPLCATLFLGTLELGDIYKYYVQLAVSFYL